MEPGGYALPARARLRLCRKRQAEWARDEGRRKPQLRPPPFPHAV